MSDSSVLDTLSQEQSDADNEFEWATDDAFRSLCPNLAEILLNRQVRGKERGPGKLSVFIDGGKIKVALSAPSEGLVAFLTLSDLKGIWMTIEKALTTGVMEWRPDKKHSGKKGSPF